jgi:polyisoprenoid-binding protein YceI
MKLLHLAAAASLAFSAQALAADKYAVDPAHTTAQFVVGHLGFSHLVGRFNELSGEFTLDADNPANNSASFVVQTGSIDSNHGKRDEHLRSPDFFNAVEFPELSFVSTGYAGSAEKGVLSGNLTMLGQTRPVSFELTKVGEGDDPWGGFRAGYDATATIKRSEWGMQYGLPNIPDDVTLNLFVEGIRQ